MWPSLKCSHRISRIKEYGMAINTSKTKLMLITTHQKRAVLDSDQLFLALNNETLNTINKDKILGVSIDNNLSWSSHIDQISFKTRCRVYSLCVRSAMLHASETWPVTKPSLQRLQRNDRAMIRQICNV